MRIKGGCTYQSWLAFLLRGGKMQGKISRWLAFYAAAKGLLSPRFLFNFLFRRQFGVLIAPYSIAYHSIAYCEPPFAEYICIQKPGECKV